MKRISFFVLFLVVCAVLANHHKKKHHHHKKRPSNAGKSYQDYYFDVESLEQEDERGLRGLSYNTTQPEVKDPNEFAGKRIGFLVGHCVEEPELTFPWIYFNNRSATVDIISVPWTVDGWVVTCHYVRANLWAKIDYTFEEALKNKYDVLIIPGGVWSSTIVRNDENALALLKKQYKEGGIIAPVCSGSTVMINAGFVQKGTPLTGTPSMKIDLENAGGVFYDQPVVIDNINKIIYGRSPGGQDNHIFVESIAQMLRKN